MLRKLVTQAMQTPDGQTRTFRAGPAVFLVAHRGSRWGVRVTITTPHGVSSARVVTDEAQIRALLRTAQAVVGDDGGGVFVGASSASVVRDAIRRATAQAARKQQRKARPGPVSPTSYRRVVARGGALTPIPMRQGADGSWSAPPAFLRYGLPPFPLRGR